MNAERLAELKRINAAAAARKNSEMSALAIKVVLAGATVAGMIGGMAVLVKAAGL